MLNTRERQRPVRLMIAYQHEAGSCELLALPPSAVLNLLMVNFLADDTIIASFVSSSYYKSFMKVLEAFFHTFVAKMDSVQGN